MKKSAKRLARRAKVVGASLAGGAKGTALQVAVGAIVGYARKFLDDKVEALGTRPWATPAVVALAGHLAKKKVRFASLGPALCGASGAMLGQWYRDRQNAAPAQTTNVQGLGDAGLVYQLPVAPMSAPAIEAPPVEADAGLVQNRVFSLRAS